MQCEICGADAGKGKRIEMDGIELLACENCVRFGKEIPEQATEKAPNKHFGKKISFEPREQFETLVFVEDFGARIKRAREQKQLTFEDLSRLVREKMSVLRNIESGHLEPGKDLAKRIEQALGIKIIEKKSEQTG